MTPLPEIAVTDKTNAVLASLAPVGSYPVRLNPAVWPTCILCGLDFNECRCNPDEAATALLADRREMAELYFSKGGVK